MKGLKYIACLFAGSLIITLIAGCSSESSSPSTETTVVIYESAAEAVQESGNETEETGSLKAEYDAEDLQESWSAGKSTIIKCNGTSAEISGDGIQADGNILKITQAGTYVFSGIMDDGQIRVYAGKEDVIHLVLNGLTASSDDSSVIYGVQSKKIVITLAPGQENILSDAEAYIYEDASADEPNACIFSKDDLTINGRGSLNIYGNYQDGIHCNGDIRINNGTYMMESRGAGIHADNKLVITGGDIQINKSFEGLEGLTVEIRGGNIKVTSMDDGINSAGGSDTLSDSRPGQNSFASGNDCRIRISGGTIYVKAAGDGIDSDGNLYVDGGMLVIEGPEDSANGTLDYEGRAEITGGTFVGTGNSGMAMAFSDSSAQYSINVVTDTMLPSGTMVTLKDSSGKEILSVSPTKSFNCIQISSPTLVSGETYTLVYGEDSSAEITLDGVSVWSGQGGTGGNPAAGGAGTAKRP